jgi:uncharacterized protein YyaL (SSP411 family)
MLHHVQKDMELYGPAYSNWGMLHLHMTCKSYEIVVSGKDALERKRRIAKEYIPLKIMAGSTRPSELPMLKGRWKEDVTQILICSDQSCMPPFVDTSDAIRQLII